MSPYIYRLPQQHNIWKYTLRPEGPASDMPANQIQYSEKYYDDVYEYRHGFIRRSAAPHAAC